MLGWTPGAGRDETGGGEANGEADRQFYKRCGQTGGPRSASYVVASAYICPMTTRTITTMTTIPMVPVGA